MSELRAWTRRDRGDHAPDAPDMPARDAPRLPQPIRDAETRISEALEYRKRVDAVYAGQAPERTPVEGPEQPASGIAKRRDSPGSQKEEQGYREHRRLPSNETAQFAASLGVVATTISDVLNIMPAKLDAVAASLLGAVIAGVAWGNKRWKDKHADRPED
jgi:hypothetical protein